MTPEARKLVKALQDGIDSAAAVARRANMDRAFAIAPTASCSYRYTDLSWLYNRPRNRTADRAHR